MRMSAEMSIEAGLLELDDAIGAARLYFRDVCADAEKVAARVRDRVQIGEENTVVAFAARREAENPRSSTPLSARPWRK